MVFFNNCYPDLCFFIYCQKVYDDDLIDRDKFLSYIGMLKEMAPRLGFEPRT